MTDTKAPSALQAIATREAERARNGGFLVRPPANMAEINNRARMLDPAIGETVGKPNAELAAFMSWLDAIDAANGGESDIRKAWDHFKPGGHMRVTKIPLMGKLDTLMRRAGERDAELRRRGDKELAPINSAKHKAAQIHAAQVYMRQWQQAAAECTGLTDPRSLRALADAQARIAELKAEIQQLQRHGG